MIKIYNTLNQKKEDFKPTFPDRVSMYVCGPTTYDYFHVGNGRAFLFFDVVRRFFQYAGYKVLYVQNITDIDDKIIRKANAEKVQIAEITKKYIKAFKEDIKALGIKNATYFPKATEYVGKMIEFIKSLEDNGYAYHSEGDVFFSVEQIHDYGTLSRKKLDDLVAGARVAENTAKKAAADFVLWKKAKQGEPAWDSPWGKGRPGWHTECVVMANYLLSKENKKSDSATKVFDIHAGGVDLVFPHHENEIAQAKAGYNSHLANYWMHNGFINIEGEKMSKSLDNFLTIRNILKEYDPEAIRYFYLSKHYRSPIDFNEQIIKESTTAVNKLTRPLKDYLQKEKQLPVRAKIDPQVKKDFDTAMKDDFNTAKALAVLFELAKEINISPQPVDDKVATLYKLGSVLGFFSNVDQKESQEDNGETTQQLINLLIEYRNKFKREKNYVYADMIREDLANLGFILKDTKDGTVVEKT